MRVTVHTQPLQILPCPLLLPARDYVSVAVLRIRKRRGDTETVGGGGNSAAFGQSLLALHLGKIAGEPDDLAQLTVRIGSGSLYHAARSLIAPAEVHKPLSAGTPLNLPASS